MYTYVVPVVSQNIELSICVTFWRSICRQTPLSSLAKETLLLPQFVIVQAVSKTRVYQGLQAQLSCTKQ